MKIIDPQGRPAFDPEFLTIEPAGRIFMSRLPNVATALTLVSGTAYFVYVGRVTQPVTCNYVYFYVNTAGTGTETKEVGLFSTPSAPNNASQVLTKLAAVGTANIDQLTSTGLKWNSNLNFNYTVPAGTHLWAGIRTQGYTQQPALSGLCMDFGGGLILSVASLNNAFTSATTTWTGALISAGQYLNTALAPDLRVTLNL